MAFPTIERAPAEDSMRSTLLPITFEIDEGSADTLYIVAVIEYDLDGSWVDLGTGIRLAQDLDDSTRFYFNAEQLLSTLTYYDYDNFSNRYAGGQNDYRIGEWGRIYGLTGVATGGGANINLKQSAVWSIKVRFYREYLDATTGLIVTDPNETLSDGFYISELGLSQVEMFASRQDDEYEKFHLIGDNTASPLYYRLLSNAPQPIKTNLSATNFISGLWSKNTAQDTSQALGFILVQTLNNQLGQVGTHIINGEISSLSPLVADYGVWDILGDTTQFIVPIGLRDMAGAINGDDPWVWPNASVPLFGIDTFFPNESTDGLGTSFNNVDSYIVSVIDQTSTCILSQVVFVNTEGPNYATSTGEILCGSDFEESNYPNLVFHFKNRLGGFDRFENVGKYTIKKNIKSNTFERRQFSTTNTSGVFDKLASINGKMKIATESVDKYSVTTQHLSSAEAEWLTEMFGSTQVMIQVPSSTAVGGKVYSQSMLLPVLINDGSIKYHNTDEGTIEIEFSMTVAKTTKVPRN